MAKKICFLTGEYPPMQGGIADHTSHLARHLVPYDCQISVLTSTKAHPQPEVAPGASAAEVHPIMPAWGFRSWQRIRMFLDRTQPDLLHIQYQAAAFDLGGWVNFLPWRLQGNYNRPQIVVTFHDLRVPYLFPKAGNLRWQSILYLARYSDAVITTNAGDEHVLRQYPWATRVRRIPLGSNVEPSPPPGFDRHNWRFEQLGVEDDTMLMAYFGFLNQSKGGVELVLALDNLCQQGYNVKLLMIGGQLGDADPTNVAYADQVRSLIHSRQLDDRVIWTGHCSSAEVSANLMAADVLVMPYRDGVSFRRTTLIAALRHHCPVITTRPTHLLPELRDGENVLLVPPHDENALAGAVAKLAETPTLRLSLAEGAYNLGQQFEWSQIAKQTDSVYQDLVASQ